MTVFDPDYLPGRVIRVPVTIAPIEVPEYRYGRNNWGDLNHHTPQAQRCLRCGALVAVGDSFKDHIFWCKRVPDRLTPRVPA